MAEITCPNCGSKIVGWVEEAMVGVEGFGSTVGHVFKVDHAESPPTKAEMKAQQKATEAGDA
jgi:hypothetical protein